MFQGKKILVGVTGGIAAYKAADLVSALRKDGAEVWVLMTENAKKFISPMTFRALSHNPVITKMFDRSDKRFPHLSLAENASAFIIVPATANFIAKAAHGIADDIVSTTFISVTCPILIAPAMNSAMYENPIVQGNLATLKKAGITLITPATGTLACGQSGVGKLADLNTIIGVLQKEVLKTKHKLPLQGKRIVITGGGTREAIDPVRYVTNASSGKMGQALREAAARTGARVEYIDAATSVEVLRKKVLKSYPAADALIMAAAVSDYRPLRTQKKKIKSSAARIVLELEKTPDILAELGKKKKKQVLVGFCLETGNVADNARLKLRKKNCDLMIANTPAALGSAQNKAMLVYPDGKITRLPKMSKKDLAEKIIGEVRRMFSK